MNEIILLRAIGSTEATTFRELCAALKENKPNEKREWRELFIAIEHAEASGLIEVERTNGKIDVLILTPEGADKVREAERR